MGKVKFLRGVESHYNATTHQDGIYFTTDDDNVNSIIMNGRKYGAIIDDVYVNLAYLTENTTSSFSAANKRYNIAEELTLTSNASYPIGEGSILHFMNGGKITGSGKLLLNNTQIEAPMKLCFDLNVSFDGLMRNSECYPEWWGAKGDGVSYNNHDDADAINRCIVCACHTPVVLTAENYLVKSTINYEEDVYNEPANRAAGQTNWAATANICDLLIVKHNIIGDASLVGPVLRFATSYGICKVNGVIVVRSASDDAVGFTTFPTKGKSYGGANNEIYIHSIRKGATANHYYGYSLTDYNTTYGVGNSVGAAINANCCNITINHIAGFKLGLWMSRVIDCNININECEATYCFYISHPKEDWYNSASTYNGYVTRNIIFLGKQYIGNTGYSVPFITGVTDSSLIREIGNEEISMNRWTIGDSNGGANKRHPHKHSLYYTAGSSGHTGNIYNFNITYGVESTRNFIKYEYSGAPGGANLGQSNGDTINFGVSCYLRDMDIPYGWNVKFNNVLISNNNQTTGSYRWFGSSGIILIDTVTLTKASTPIFASDSPTIKLLSINPLHKGNIIATDTVPSTCENNKLYVVDNAQETITTNGTKKYPVYAKYFGTDATLVGYTLDNYKDVSSLIPEGVVETTYSELVTLRGNNGLVPGTWYRITDYQCTSVLSNTHAASNLFDILVLATSENTLSEIARAALHSGDTYFANSNLDAWQIWYCMDNDTDRFAWADTTNGKGVIYRMIDEFDNDLPYDFKNIMFQRTITDGAYASGGTNTWCYTLNIWQNNSCKDASVIGNTLINDENYVTGVYKNKFGTCTEFDVYGHPGNTLKFRLGNNVVLTIDYDNEYYGCHSNTIGNGFYDNTIGNQFSENIIGNHFHSNTIGQGFLNNTIGNYYTENSIGNNFYYNTIGNNFYSSTIGDNFYSNTIGNSFGSNTIGNHFNYNMIGNNFYSNTIGNYFGYNTIGNYSNYNTIGIGTGSTATKINNVRYIRIEDGVQFVNITTTATTSASAYLQNITISQGIAGVSNSNRKTIIHPTVGDTFQTIYRPANSQVITV